jgi:Flp pilus assembly protein TadD
VPRLVLAMALDDLGESDGALAELAALAARHPRSARAHLGLAALLAKRGRAEEARRELERARSLGAAE